MAASPTLDTSATIVRDADPLSADVHDETILMVPKQECYVGMNAVAAAVWKRLETPTTVGALISELQRAYQGDPARIATDVMALLDKMISLDLLTVVEPSARSSEVHRP